MKKLGEKKLGIIGGAGHIACVFYEKKLLHKISFTSSEKLITDSTFPSLFSINSHFNGISLLGVIKPDDVFQELNHRINLLKSFSIDSIILTCGSLFPYVSTVNVPNIIDWITFGANHIASTKKNKIGVLSSQSSLENNIFSKTLSDFGVECIVPSQEIQDLTNSLINCGIHGGNTEEQIFIFEKICSFYQEQGAEAIWLACTDLYFISPSCSKNIVFYQSFDFMVDATINNLLKD